MSKVLFPSAISKVETLADRTIKLTVLASKEMSASETSKLFGLVHNEGWTLFSSNDDITEADVPDEKPDTFATKKTPGQRLRNRLFVYYTKTGRGEKHLFNQWYESELERIGEKYMDKLDA